MIGSEKGNRMRARNDIGCWMLTDVQPGQRVKIQGHHAKGAVRQRLLDLGFVPQTEIDVIRRAPLGDPIECRVANYKVALRSSEASLIEVECE